MPLDTPYTPHPGLTIEQLIDLRRSEPQLIHDWRKHVVREQARRRQEERERKDGDK